MVPTRSPTQTKIIADVMGVPSTRRETTPKAINANATTARAQSIGRPYREQGGEARGAGAILQSRCPAQIEISPPPADRSSSSNSTTLAGVLADCVAGGASVSYLEPFPHEQARAAFEGFAAEVERGGRSCCSPRSSDGALVGTVQVILAPAAEPAPPRARSPSCSSHRSARRRGVAERLMEAAEAEARAEGKTLLVLDTVTGDAAERLYSPTWLDEGRHRSPGMPCIPMGGRARRPSSGRSSS